MIDIYVLLASAFLLFGLLGYFTHKRRELRSFVTERLTTLLPSIEAAVKDWRVFLGQSTYFTNSLLITWLDQYKNISDQIQSLPKAKPQNLDDADISTISDFKKYFSNAHTIRDLRNQDYIKQEKVKYRGLFNSTLSPPLTDAQQNAILHDEDNTLVVAGAGTGKTTTLVGKAAYLVESKKVTPDEILAIAFTTKAAQEMEDRLQGLLDEESFKNGDSIKVKTFHALGYEIIGIATGAKPDLVFNGDNRNTLKFITQCLDTIWKNPSLTSTVRNFLLYQLKPAKGPHEYDHINDYIQYVKGHGLRTIDDKYTVKSFEELSIANCLWEHGINYEYEARYKEADTRAHDHSYYKPDFYLPDYGIYIEHYALNSNGEVPSYFRGRNGLSAQRYYTDGIEWKRRIHNKNNTKLIETYSYQAYKGVLNSVIINHLKEYSVRVEMKSDGDIMMMCKQSKYMPYISKLMYTFLVLMKSNKQTAIKIEKLAREAKDSSTVSQKFCP